MAKIEVMTEDELARAAESDPKSLFVCSPMEWYTNQDASFAECCKCSRAVFFIDRHMADVKNKICLDCMIGVLSKLSQTEWDQPKLATTRQQLDILKRRCSSR